jgi:hypothetical protein
MTADETIDVDVLLELKDYLRANYWFVFRKIRFFIAMCFFVAFAYPLLYFSGAMGDPSRNPNESNWGFLIPIAVLLICFVGVYVSVYFSSKRYLASNKLLQETIRFSFSETGIQTVAPSSSGSQKWETLREAIETKHNFLLFIADRQMYVLPKRCFNDDDQIRSFKELLRRRLESHAKLKK